MQIHSSVRYGDVEGVRRRLKNFPVNDQGTALLNVAAASHHAGVDMLQLLIEHGTNPNSVVKENMLEETPLGTAAKAGNVDKVRYLLQVGADPHFGTSQGYTPLINAVFGQYSTRSEIVRLLLERGANPNQTTSYKESPLVTALYFGDFETIRILVDAGADLDILGWNPLMRAIAFGSLDQVQAELEHGADPNESKPCRMTPWLLSLQVGDVPKAEKLLEHDANIESSDLFIAVRKDNPELVTWLLGYGLDVNLRDDYQKSVLHEAAEWGATACVKLLIAAGADVHAEDHVQSQPISNAPNPEIARLLVEAGVGINFIGGEGYSLLKHSAERGNVEMVRALLEMGVDTEAETNRYTTTPLYVAVSMDDLEIARILLDGGANPNAQNADGWFPLSNAQSVEMVQLLLDHGADLHLTDDTGRDALQEQKDPEVADYLIKAGAQVNPDRGQSAAPLRAAANDSNLEMMRLLLRQGANVNQAMSWGQTALMVCAEHSFVEGARLLLQHHADLEQADEDGRTTLFYAAAPEGFTSYKLMKEAEQRTWRDYVPEAHRALFEQAESTQHAYQYRPTYGYIASDSVEIVEMLVNAGENINARDRRAMTPLMLAAGCGRPARVRALRRLGADVHLVDEHGKSALEHAQLHPEAHHREEIIRLLTEVGSV